jgi:type II secretory pathway pseudopilin PulG
MAPPKARPAFTIIELMVVVGIIIILMAILIPALSGAKKSAYLTQTTAQLQGISNDIETYFTNFDSYPGPAPASSTTTTTAANKISGNQNLLMALSYSIYDSTPAPVPSGWKAVGLPGAGTAVVRTDAANGPRDNGKEFPAFYNPTPKEITAADSSGNWLPAGIEGADTTANTFKFPVLLDRYPDPLPILYYRRTPSVDGSVSFDGSGNVVSASQTMVSVAPATAIRPYYLADNAEYTNTSVMRSPSGAICDQSKSSLYNTNAPGTIDNLAALIAQSSTANSTVNAHGSYVLISAGFDRLYGRNTSNNAKTDDIVIIGGH